MLLPLIRFESKHKAVYERRTSQDAKTTMTSSAKLKDREQLNFIPPPDMAYRYLHSFLGDRRDYFQVLCNSLTYASIGCRMLFHLQCIRGLDMRGIGHHTHTERHVHCRSYRLQIQGNARSGMGSGLVYQETIHWLLLRFPLR